MNEVDFSLKKQYYSKWTVLHVRGRTLEDRGRRVGPTDQEHRGATLATPAQLL